MEYISNAFSANMIGDATVKFKEISKKEFVDAGKRAESYVGHEEIADHFGLEYNRSELHLQKGDILYIVSPAFRPSEDRYTFIKEEEGYIYRKIEVVG